MKNYKIKCKRTLTYELEIEAEDCIKAEDEAIEMIEDGLIEPINSNAEAEVVARTKID